MAADRATKNMLYDGASVSQLGVLFDKDNRTVAGKIADLSPCGKRQGHPIYSIKEAAPYLCKPAGDMEEYIRRMHHRDLPPLLLKEYWAGQMAKQKFEENEGDLWRTDQVMEHFAETFKTLRMSILLMKDRLERDTTLTPKQNEFIGELIDGALKDLSDSLIERFKDEPKRIKSGDSIPVREEQPEPEDDPYSGL